MLRRYAAQGLVAEAGRMALAYFGRKESLGVTMKGTQDWLTVADGAVEDFLHARDFFAGDGISKGNPILCSTPALASQLSEITGIS